MKKTRLKKGLTQIEVAKITNISVISYQRYEAGERSPNVKIARLIAIVLNSTVENLFK